MLNPIKPTAKTTKATRIRLLLRKVHLNNLSARINRTIDRITSMARISMSTGLVCFNSEIGSVNTRS